MTRLRSGVIVSVIVLLASLIAAPAYALDGVHHHPTGIDDLYSTEPTERSPATPWPGRTSRSTPRPGRSSRVRPSGSPGRRTG
ncbi:hypothetical protein [Nonomuraea recticatena]|uniref:hypothetical protein n=1 Tax=Nonomuraea recticatena TaxID=46178 RepID=UPI0036096FCD